MKQIMIRIGNFLFRYRNKIFPLLIVALFLVAPPPIKLFGSVQYEGIKDILAFLIALSGLAVRGVVIGYAYIKRGGVNKKVYADDLVTQGMFSLCRNPLYVGNMLIYIGVFIMHGNALVMTAGIGLYLFIYYCIIFAEEAYLEAKFGEQYRVYCRDVPRWIPKLSCFRTATNDMTFDIKRIFIKDYSTMASTLVTLCVVQLYEHLGFMTVDGHEAHLILLGVALICIGLAAALIRSWKKRPAITL